MFGRPASAAEFRRINRIGGAIILLAALLPPLAVRAWRHRIVRASIPVVGWIAAVGCCVHALTDVTQDALGLTGLRPIHHPSGLWSSIDHRAAAVQDAVFNEPWFFIEGCLWGVFALSGLAAALTAAMVAVRGHGGRARVCLRRADRARRRAVVSIRVNRAAVRCAVATGRTVPPCPRSRAVDAGQRETAPRQQEGVGCPQLIANDRAEAAARGDAHLALPPHEPPERFLAGSDYCNRRGKRACADALAVLLRLVQGGHREGIAAGARFACRTTMVVRGVGHIGITRVTDGASGSFVRSVTARGLAP